MSMNWQPENAPGQIVAGSPGSCGLIMVNRTKLTPAVPAVGITVFSRCRSAGPKVPLAASVKVVPSTEVSTFQSFVEALPPSPQVLPGSIAIAAMFTARGSFTVTNFGSGAAGFGSDVLPQPLPSDWSIALDGPQPNPVKSGPLNAATVPPPASAAQSRRNCQSRLFGCEPTLIVATCRSYPALRAFTSGYVPGRIPVMV